MSLHHHSRRKFLRSVAAGSTAAAFIPLPEGRSAPPGVTPSAVAEPDPPFPLTVDSYPISEPGRSSTVDHLKIVTWYEFPAEIQTAIRGASPGIELKQCGSDAEYLREIADAHVIFGDVSRQDLAA